MSRIKGFCDRIEIESIKFERDEGLKQLANTIPQLAWMADSEGFIHWYNDRWYEYTGTCAASLEWKSHLERFSPLQGMFPLSGA